MSVCVVSLDSLCILQVQVSVYCCWPLPAHLRCTQCSILLNRMDMGLTQFAQQFMTAVTAPPLVGCVVWSIPCSLCVALVMDLFLLSDSVWELFGEIIINTFNCGCYFAVEC